MNFYHGDVNDLVQDKFSNLMYGEQAQLKVLGHTQKGCIKTHVVSCILCQKDSELFHQGLFEVKIGHLKSGKLPCGCSVYPKWNMDQQIIRCKRVADNMGVTFKLNPEEQLYIGQETSCTLVCEIHGEWVSRVKYILLQKGCKRCSDEYRNKKPDSIMIQSFFDTGVFHPDTKFYRSQRPTSQGARNYWWVDCPLCNSKSEVNSSDLRKGSQSCECIRNQRQSYVNIIKDSGIPVAIKFGISKSYKSRVLSQNRKSVFDIQNLKVWEFPTKESCLSAELECKQTLVCGILSKGDMFDGFSETTYICNLDKISEIFQYYGGVPLPSD